MHRMNIKPGNLLLYAVTADGDVEDSEFLDNIEAAIQGGVTCLQLRDKNRSDSSLFLRAKKVSAICKYYRIPFILNDRTELARRIPDAGVHLGASDMAPRHARRILGSERIIGATARNLADALKAQEEGADYIGVGALFPTQTKLDTEPVSRDELTRIAKALTVPVVAIGGISRSNVLLLAETGIAGIASVSAIFGEKDVRVRARNLRQRLDQMNFAIPKKDGEMTCEK